MAGTMIRPILSQTGTAVQRLLVLILLLTAGAPSRAAAQAWRIAVSINPYPSPYINQWESNPSAVGSVTIFNNSGRTAPLHIRTTVSLLGTGEVIESVTNDFLVPSGVPFILDNTRLVKFADATYPRKDLKDKVLQTGRLPAGKYTACFQLENETGLALIPPQCANFTIVYPEPPRLLLPVNGDSLPTATPIPTFQWTPVVAPADYRILYVLRLVEVLPGQVASQALRANIPRFEDRSLTSTTFTYPISALPLEQGKTYAWQIQALDQYGLPPTENQGRSEIFEFTVKGGVTALAYVQTPPPFTLNCGCGASAPGGSAKTNFTVNTGFTFMMGKYELTVTTVLQQPGADGVLNGEGTIQFPLVPAIPVRVNFWDVKINDQNVAIAGNAESKQKDGVGWLPALDPPQLSTTPLSLANVQDMKQYFLDQKDQLVSQAKNVKNSIGFEMPLGLDKDVGGKTIVIAITGIYFTTTAAAMDALVEVDLPDGNPGAVALGARGVCVDAGSVCGQGTLFLAQDFTLSLGGGTMTLKKFSGTGTAADSGTYVTFDKDGFRGLRIRAEYAFPPSMLARADSGGPVVATLAAVANSWSDWVASVNLPQFRISGLDQFSFSVQNASYDHSDLANPNGLPAKYNQQGLLWTGFYAPAVSVGLPSILKKHSSQAPLTVSAGNLIIDGQGVSVDVNAANVLSLGDGDLGGWYCSIDSITASFYEDAFTAGAMKGRIVLPISGGDLSSKNQLHYTSTMSKPPGGSLGFQFVVLPTNGISVPMWHASLDLAPTSNITVTVSQGSFGASATLDGDLSINAALSPLGSVDFKLIEFTGLEVMTQAPYFDLKNFTAGLQSPDKFIGGFPITLNAVGPAKSGPGIRFDLGLTLCEAVPSIGSADFGFELLGQTSTDAAGRPTLTVKGMKADSIALKCQVGPVHVEGEAAFVSNTAYASTIEGSVQAAMFSDFQITATVLFGRSKVTPSYPVWYVSAALPFPGGIPVAGTPFSIFGFGGGAYYNLSHTSLTADQVWSSSSAHPVSVSYTPSKGQIGFQAAVIVGLADGNTFHAKGTMDVQLNSSTMSISMINFDVSAYLLAPLMNSSKAVVSGHGSITLDVAHDVFKADINPVKLTAPALSGTGTLHLLVDGGTGDWYLKIGEPQDRETLSIASLFDMEGYLMMGTNLPAASPLPDYVPGNIKSEIASGGYELGGQRNTLQAAKGSGLVFGASLHYGGNLEFLFFYMHLEAGLGFDISLLHYTGGCNGDPSKTVGFNGWYAKGQLWAFAQFSAGLDVDLGFWSGRVEAMSLSAGAVFQIGTANPTWFKGWLYGHYDLFDGLIEGDMAFRVEVSPSGVCNPTQSPLQTVPLISDLEPEGQSIPIDTDPDATFNFPVGKEFPFHWIDDNGYDSTRYFKIEIVDFSVWKGSTKVVADNVGGKVHIADVALPKEASLYHTDAFDPNSEYHVKLAVQAYQRTLSGTYAPIILKGGKPLIEEREATFTTGGCVMDVSKPGVVVATYPFDRQRYFLQGENQRKGFIMLKENYPCFLNQTSGTYFVIFSLLPGHTTVESPASYDGKGTFSFMIPQLETERIYDLRLVWRAAPLVPLGRSLKYAVKTRALATYTTPQGTGRVDINELKIVKTSQSTHDVGIYHYYFRTSKYSTMWEKLDATSFETTAKNEFAVGDLIFELYGDFSAAEPFDWYDARGTACVIRGVDEYIRPQVWLKESPGANPWYNDYVKKTYDLADKAQVVPFRSLKEKAVKGWFPPTGEISLEGFMPPLSDAEILKAKLSRVSSFH